MDDVRRTVKDVTLYDLVIKLIKEGTKFEQYNGKEKNKKLLEKCIDVYDSWKNKHIYSKRGNYYSTFGRESSKLLISAIKDGRYTIDTQPTIKGGRVGNSTLIIGGYRIEVEILPEIRIKSYIHSGDSLIYTLTPLNKEVILLAVKTIIRNAL